MLSTDGVAGWIFCAYSVGFRTAQTERFGIMATNKEGGDARMGFIIFNSTWPGRLLRVLIGLVLLGVGYLYIIEFSVMWLVLALGAWLVLSGVLNVCLLNALFGGSIRGKKNL